jgi:general transcription factor 3C polypeptide 3 (transcription factor C subunit 4)
MQRQSDNRHHLVIQVCSSSITFASDLNSIQAMAFLSQYRKLRGEDNTEMREIEYNFGRVFHQLGLYSHAVKHYEHVLELAEKAGVSHPLAF